MTQEEKQLLLKDLCTRLPYGVKVNFRSNIEFLCEVHIYQSVQTVVGQSGILYDVDMPNVKPYLRPLSSMTEEEFKMVCSMNALTDTELRDRINFPNMFVKSYTIETFDLFNSHHFDYRGLIPMGLALEAPDDMYKTEQNFVDENKGEQTSMA